MNLIKTRIARLSAAFVLALGMVSVPASAQAAPHPCPRVEFLGLHGLNEGDVGTFPKEEYWGKTIQSVWDNFEPHFTSIPAHATAISYPRFILTPAKFYNVARVETSADFAAAVLQAAILNLQGRNYCIVIAGYSQGAWAVDKAIRSLGGSTDQTERLALHNVVGIFLMGDPAWPAQDSYPDRMGLATRFQRGYGSMTEYLNNEMSNDAFASICATYGDGGSDPVCMSSTADILDNRVWQRDIPLHDTYRTSVATKGGADFLAARAQR
jgi:hypothetical protein